MSKFNPLWWSKPPVILSCVVAVLSVIAALFIGRLLQIRYEFAPLSLFLCAIMLSAWFGGVKPGLLAVALSLVAFDYYFVSPINSLAVEIKAIPRLILAALAALFIVALSAAQRSTAEALRRSEDRLRLVADTIPVCVWTALPDGSLDFINQRLQEFSGFSLDEVRDWHWTSLIHPDDRARALDEWHTALATGQELKTETRLRRAQGDYRWLSIHVVPFRDESGKIVKWYGTKTDITERKQAEEALHKAQAELARVTRVMTMGELGASIAHELNQPLGAIVTNGQACLRLLSREAEDIEKSREAIGRMISDGVRASEVIQRIRNLLQKTPLEKETLNMNETIKEVIALVSGDMLRSQVKLETELAADLPPVVGDRVQLQQVILNLILNARDAMSAVPSDLHEILITSRKGKSGEVVIEVRDSGIGLDPKDAGRIFDAFFTTKTEGMGLGLTISRTIIENHGGKIWATPNDGKGATIQFTLPPDSGSEQ